MSVALQVMPDPDWASATIVAVPPTATRDAQTWARAIFDFEHGPVWIRALFDVRNVFARALGIAPGEPQMLAVDRVEGDEALIDTDDRHLHFVAGIRADPGFVTVTTAVRLKGRRGRAYFVPVRFLHDIVTRRLVVAAAARLR